MILIRYSIGAVFLKQFWRWYGYNFMKQMHPPTTSIVDIPLTGVAEVLHPIVFKEGNMFCCLLGPNPQTGVMGCGDTAELALADWNEQLKEHLSTADEDDEVVAFVKELVTPPLSDLHIKYGLRPVDKLKRRS
jgi:hypothetical protein